MMEDGERFDQMPRSLLRGSLLFTGSSNSSGPWPFKPVNAGASPVPVTIFCAHGVVATQWSASPQSRVRSSVRAPRSRGVTVAQRTFNPFGVGANPADSTSLGTTRKPVNPAACKAVTCPGRHRGCAPYFEYVWGLSSFSRAAALQAAGGGGRARSLHQFPERRGA